MNGETSAILTTETVCRPRLTPCSRQADRMAGAGSRIEESAFGSKSIWASTYLTSLTAAQAAPSSTGSFRPRSMPIRARKSISSPPLTGTGRSPSRRTIIGGRMPAMHCVGCKGPATHELAEDQSPETRHLCNSFARTPSATALAPEHRSEGGV
jgi:hypothetical protein